MLFANLPRSHNRVITSYARKDREVVMQKALDSLNQPGSFRRFMDSSNDCWMLCDEYQAIEHMSPAFRDMLDVSPEADIEGELLIDLPLSVHPHYVENCVKHMRLAQKQDRRLKTLEIHPRCNEEDPCCVSFEYSTLHNPKTGMNRVIVQGRLEPGDFDLKTLVEKLPIIQGKSEE